MTYFELSNVFHRHDSKSIKCQLYNKRPVLTVAFNSLNVMNSFNVNVNYFDFFYPAICWVMLLHFKPKLADLRIFSNA